MVCRVAPVTGIITNERLDRVYTDVSLILIVTSPSQRTTRSVPCSTARRQHVSSHSIHTRPSANLSLYLSIYLSGFFCLSIRVYTGFLSVCCLFACTGFSACLSVGLSVCLSVCTGLIVCPDLSVCSSGPLSLSVFLSACQSVRPCLSVCLSVISPTGSVCPDMTDSLSVCLSVVASRQTTTDE